MKGKPNGGGLGDGKRALFSRFNPKRKKDIEKQCDLIGEGKGLGRNVTPDSARCLREAFLFGGKRDTSCGDVLMRGGEDDGPPFRKRCSSRKGGGR